MPDIVPPAIEAYAAEASTPPSELLCELEDYTRRHCRDPQMLVGPLQGALLKMLVRLIGARRVLEIGLYTGYSALTLAEALPEDGVLISCEIEPQFAAIARRFFDRSPHGHKITIRLGRALETLETLSGPFDFVFLDADKEAYVAYYEAVLPKLRPGGLLVADNVLWSGRVLDPRDDAARAIAAFNARAHADPRVEAVLLTVRDGVSVIRKK